MLTTRHIDFAATISYQQNLVDLDPQPKAEGLPFTIH